MNREVVTCSIGAEEALSHHEVERNIAVARMIAELMGWEFAGECQDKQTSTSQPYLVPHKTIVGLDKAARLGIHSVEDLYGGVVPYGYQATKSITHGLIGSGASQPAGWSRAFARATRDAVLPGYTVFSIADAHTAANSLLTHGPVRVKKALASGGQGQYVVRTIDEMVITIKNIKPYELACFGLILEQNLNDEVTQSVGQVRVNGFLASYYGTQRVTANNQGIPCYGGSDLVIIRGGYDRLLRLSIPENLHLAVVQAATYDRATRYYPDILASRRNYDVGQGTDSRGNFLSGVLEQSWRIGGASGPEIAALQVFKGDPELQMVHASSFEKYGENVEVPANSFVHFHGIAPDSGPMTIYTVVSQCR